MSRRRWWLRQPRISKERSIGAGERARGEICGNAQDGLEEDDETEDVPELVSVVAADEDEEEEEDDEVVGAEVARGSVVVLEAAESEVEVGASVVVDSVSDVVVGAAVVVWAASDVVSAAEVVAEEEQKWQE